MNKPEPSIVGNEPLEQPVAQAAAPADESSAIPPQEQPQPSPSAPPPRRNPAALFFVAAIVAALLFVGFHAARRSNGGGPDSLDPAGKTAPDFTLQTLDGKNVSLSSFRGKGVLLNFWATWCGPCKIEMPWFVELQKEYGAQGL